ncbi:MAG: four helix bundle protein [Melioribacteraceae bacterium]|nr:four helix bundle protein [Melioribacteraceae bacterium]MCF8412155.1 four helix bundle protein [Melioribacteraceae bacterium]MCF8431835.1 four helix bundle protein [Melioribacteraceae bacterium]
MNLEDLEIYRLSINLGENVWKELQVWEPFLKNTLGSQLIRASDSVTLNIAEGFGRFTFKETKRFAYYARGSLFETKACIQIACKRGIIEEANYEKFESEIRNLGVKLNNYIRYLNSKA